MQNKKNIVFAVAVLVIALFFGASLSRSIDPSILWAGPQLQESNTAATETQTEAQTDVEGVLPTQEVLSNLYDQVAPSVVNIQVVAQPIGMSPQQGEPEFPFGLPFGEGGEPVPVQGQGSGWIYDNEGHIVTNNHVVEGAEQIMVYFQNGMWAEAELVASDPAADLAVIRVTPPEGVDWQPLPLAPADSIEVGHYAAAVGSPFGLQETMTLGIVSAVGRSFPTGDPTTGAAYSLPDVVQTDAAINPGNSGGPLLNLNGQVVGVNFAINSTTRQNSGVGFAIPISVVEKVIPVLINEGRFAYSYLGIAGTTINAAVAEEQGIEDNVLGLYVAEVVAGSPAAEGGVEVNDVITAIDGQPVSGFEDLISYLFQSTTPGQTVTLTVVRDGEQVEVPVTVTERPQPTDEQAATPQEGEAQVSIGQAIQIARDAVAEAELMTEIDSADAALENQEGHTVWIVTLSGEGRSATVTVDANTGEVIALNVQ